MVFLGHLRVITLVSAFFVINATNAGHHEEGEMKSAMDEALSSQSDDTKARYIYRNPKETMSFFDINEGMTVVEALPGGGWYTKILVPSLGAEGTLVGANYPTAIFKNFGYDDERIAKLKSWATDWPAQVDEAKPENSANVSGFVMGELPPEMAGTADRFLFIRALHNLARFERDGGHLTTALKSAYDILKPGGIVGVVQHEAPESATDAWASGSNGYLKRDFVIAQLEAAGFEFLASSDVNANPKDIPGEKDKVWRLPPTSSKKEMLAIGESNRMTLKFIKPTS
tara:strand:- start:359 stop:1213 length:855 start_codon:yes stop_codon:yes gene_type:complete